jgi:hypothetical protein
MIDHGVLCSLQEHLRIGTRDLDHPVLTDAENTDTTIVDPCNDM